MSIRSQHPTSLKLETLELRMLLAGMDSLADEVAQALSLLGMEGDYTSQISLPRSDGGRMLTIVGPGYGALSVDFTLLPDVFTTVRVSSFDTVEFKGNDSLKNLVASDLRTLSAPGITVNAQLETYQVDDISLNAIGNIVLMKGESTRLAVEQHTPSSTFIFTDLAELEIATPSPWASEVPFLFAFAFTNPDNHTSINGRTIHGLALPSPGGPTGETGGGDGFTEEVINNVVFVSPLALRDNPLFEEFKAFVAREGEVSLRRGVIDLLSLTPQVEADPPLLLTELANRDPQFSISEEPYSSPAISRDLANPSPMQIDLDLPAAAFERPAWMLSENRDPIPSEDLDPFDGLVDHAGQLMLDLESGEMPWPLLDPIVPAAPLIEGIWARTVIDHDALEQIRHHIAEVVANSETKAVTMSEYVVERVTREFSPGYTPTLLVEQKPAVRSLSERESQQLLI